MTARLFLLLALAFVAFAGTVWLERVPLRSAWRAVTAGEAAAGNETFVKATGQPVSGASGVRGAVPAQVVQLLELEKADPADAVAQSRRRTLLLEWFQQDYAGAMEYCRALGFEDLADPEVARYVAKAASAEQLAVIIGESASPHAVARSLCEGAGLEKVQQLVQSAARFQGVAAKGFASAAGSYFAAKNIDAAIAFAITRPGDELKSAALASVIDQLGQEGKNSEVAMLYANIDPALRETDPVKSAYGQSLHDADPEAALGYLFSIGDPDTKRIALTAFAKKIEANQPGVAVSAILAAGLSGPAQAGEVERIVTEWAMLDRAAAQEFLGTATSVPAELRERLRAKIR